MVSISMIYTGDLRCESTHAPSHSIIHTDAPKDNMGKGEAFSPTDLVATALGTCVLTTMAIAARKLNVSMEGATAQVTKEMAVSPYRRLGTITVQVNMPAGIAPEHREALEKAGLNCPVHKSMHPDVAMPIGFNWE